MDPLHAKRLLPKAFGTGQIRSKRFKDDITSLEISKIAYISKPVLFHSTAIRLLGVPENNHPRSPPPCPPRLETFPDLVPTPQIAQSATTIVRSWKKVKKAAKKLVSHRERKHIVSTSATLPEDLTNGVVDGATISCARATATSVGGSNANESGATDDLLFLNLDQLEGALLYILATNVPDTTSSRAYEVR